jgi:hypothetical protein
VPTHVFIPFFMMGSYVLYFSTKFVFFLNFSNLQSYACRPSLLSCLFFPS